MDPFLQALVNQFLASNPGAAFWNVFGNQITSAPNRNLGSFIKGQQDDYQNEFIGQVLPANPSANYLDFLRGKSPMDAFNMLTPNQRGERPGMFAPSVKYVPSPF